MHQGFALQIIKMTVDVYVENSPLTEAFGPEDLVHPYHQLLDQDIHLRSGNDIQQDERLGAHNLLAQ